MKRFKWIKKSTLFIKLTEAKCDDCGKDCKNTYADLFSKGAYTESYEFIKTLCPDCIDKLKKVESDIQFENEVKGAKKG